MVEWWLGMKPRPWRQGEAKTGPACKARPGGSGASGAAWGRVGPVRAEWGLGLGMLLGFTCFLTLTLGAGYKARPSGAAWGRFGPSRAEWGRLGLSEVRGLGIGIRLNCSQTRPWHKDSPSGGSSGRAGPGPSRARAEWGWGGVGHAFRL